MSDINDGLIQYRKTNDIFFDAKEIIGCARKRAYKAADTSLVMQNWLLGRRTLLQVDDTDEDVARYSILKGNEQLFATKYKTYLPSQEELRREIERQKELFWLQHTEQDANPTDKESE